MKFNKELLANLLKKAKGDRSINGFGFEADVDPGYISRLLRCQVETPPGAMVLMKIAGKASIDITIEQLLGAAGYINFPQIDIVIEDDSSRAPWKDVAAQPPATGIATGSYGNRAPAAAKLYDSAPSPDLNPDLNPDSNPDSNFDDNSTVDELLSFCKEMMERPILLDVFKQIKDLSDDKLRRVLKMIKMIADMAD